MFCKLYFSRICFSELKYCHNQLFISKLPLIKIIKRNNTTNNVTLQKWLSFWKMLIDDYKSVLFDVVKFVKYKPFKTGLLISVFGFMTTCSSLNPNEQNFRDSIVEHSNELIFISKAIRNPIISNHIQDIHWYFNSNQIERINFGLFSIIVAKYKSDNSALFKDNCSYVQPSYLEILQNRVLDIGFLNKWWILKQKSKDYDINPMEWT